MRECRFVSEAGRRGRGCGKADTHETQYVGRALLRVKAGIESCRIASLRAGPKKINMRRG